MFDVSYLAGPVIGAVIGYCTNYIAVKMLFRPKKEIKILGCRLPFTPGVIPKGKDRLAHAVGEAVGTRLLTKEGLQAQLLSEEMEEKVTRSVMELLSESVKNSCVNLTGSEDGYKKIEEKLVQKLTDEIMDSARSLPIAEIIGTEAKAVIREKTAGTMFQMFLSDEVIDSIVQPISGVVEKYIEEKGSVYVEAELHKKMESASDCPIMELAERAGVNRQQLKDAIGGIYRKAVLAGSSKVLETISVSDMIEEKIKAMDVDELEHLVMSVMKKELNTVVNLGAIIGFLLGILNMFF